MVYENKKGEEWFGYKALSMDEFVNLESSSNILILASFNKLRK